MVCGGVVMGCGLVCRSCFVCSTHLWDANGHVVNLAVALEINWHVLSLERHHGGGLVLAGFEQPANGHGRVFDSHAVPCCAVTLQQLKPNVRVWRQHIINKLKLLQCPTHADQFWAQAQKKEGKGRKRKEGGASVQFCFDL